MHRVFSIAAFPKELTLRTGHKVTLRPLQRGDEKALLEFFLAIPEEERLFFKDDVTDREVIHGWIESLDYRRALPLLAWSQGDVVADAVLIRRRGWARDHIGEIRITVAQAYRNRGLGSAMMRELCGIADEAELEKVLFEAVADRQREAIKAAEWAGFSRVCVLEGGVRDTEGRHYDLVLMALPLVRWAQWTNF